MLAETPGEDAFGRSRRWLERGGKGKWELRPTNEPNSLTARTHDGATIVLIAGRQVVTRENLEVLGLGVDRDLPFDLSLEDTIRKVHHAGALPVVPWGFGKWWFGRGNRVLELLENSTLPPFCLGDSAGRPQGTRRPQQFIRASKRGISVLPGTDPLPLERHEDMAGKYGLILRDPLQMSAPETGIKFLLLRLFNAPETFGKRASLPRAVGTQVALRFQSRQ